jgi:hypothetical protein
MLKGVTRDGNPVLVDMENVAWALPNTTGGTRIVFNATPYILATDNEPAPTPLFIDLHLDQTSEGLTAA